MTRSLPGIHDDLNVSQLLHPDMRVQFDAGLRMPVSPRPFAMWASLDRRLAMSWGTFGHVFAAENPLVRRQTRLRCVRGHRK